MKIRNTDSNHAGWDRREFLSAVGKGAVGATVGATLLGVPGPPTVWAKEGSRFGSLSTASSNGGVVASISWQASKVGINVLDRGGNAIDAAVATLFALGVVRPDMAGIGGDGMAVLRMADGRIAALDFRCAAGSEVGPGTFSVGGLHNPSPSGLGGHAGHRTTGVPSVVAGSEALLEKFGSGKFTLRQMITNEGVSGRPPYAYELAQYGFVVTYELVEFAFLFKERLSYYPETVRVYGGMREAGSVHTLSDYAKSLRLIMDGGDQGWRAFYEGQIADAIDRDSNHPEPAIWPWGLANDVGTLFSDDLKNYRAVWRKPITGHYRNHQVITMPPPSGGGVAVMEMLNMLEGFPLGSNSQEPSDPLNAKTSWAQSSANHLHVLAEAQKLAFADRRAYIADPDLYSNVLADTEVLTSKRYGRERASLISMKEARPYAEINPGLHTNHFSIIDAAGNAIAVTNSQGDPFGSGVTVPGAGFLLTNQLADWIGRPSSEDPNSFLDQPRRGARPMTNQTPTIIVRDDAPVLVVGGAGGATVPMGVLQTIVNFVDFGLDIAHAVDAERIDAVAKDVPCIRATEGGPCLSGTEQTDLTLENDPNASKPRISAAVQTELVARKHTLKQQVTHGNYDDLPWIEAAGIDRTTGEKWAAVMDPRHRRNAISGEDLGDEEHGAAEQ
jgi:gamma-glutamyltranspeptidase / glutathione hydrolase